jgi:hypothetical protein
MSAGVHLVCLPAAPGDGGTPCPVDGYAGYTLQAAPVSGLAFDRAAFDAAAGEIALSAFVIFLTAYGVGTIVKVLDL